MALELRNLRVYYQTLRGEVRALDGASLTLADGEIMGVAGESGCGKSTLARSLVLLKPPMRYVEGEVTLDGQRLPIWDRSRMDPFRFKKIAMVPQYAMNALNPTRKLGRLIAEILASRGVRARDMWPELRRRLDLVELTPKVLDMYPIELSGGMKQRAVIVISTLLNPSLLLADEVTSALDVSTQKAVAKMLVQFRDRAFVKGMMVISHDVSVLYQMADTILVMYAGKLVEKAPTEELIHHPVHPYTQLLISSLPEVGVRHRTHRLAGLPGNPPPLLTPPPGCRFQERCPVAFDRCAQDPPFTEITEGHQVACWRADHGPR